MSTRPSFFHTAPSPAVVAAGMKVAPQEPFGAGRPLWDAGRFAEEQIRRLVRQVFFPGWPRPAHHVAFAAVDDKSDTAAICANVGEVLCAQAPGNTCIVEATPGGEAAEKPEDSAAIKGPGDEAFAPAEYRTRRLSDRLWHMPYKSFSASGERVSGTTRLEEQVRRLRAMFNYTAIHVPPVGICHDAILLGQYCDGVVLIVEANSTRRAAAQKVKEMLQAANVRLLGTVLSGRTFPIPHAIYHKL